jgi:hypothetical protein
MDERYANENYVSHALGFSYVQKWSRNTRHITHCLQDAWVRGYNLRMILHLTQFCQLLHNGRRVHTSLIQMHVLQDLHIGTTFKRCNKWLVCIWYLLVKDVGLGYGAMFEFPFQFFNHCILFSFYLCDAFLSPLFPISLFKLQSFPSHIYLLC